ncbi:hypothetical protein KCU82_g38, partial [Aureobasidium melanogenum]
MQTHGCARYPTAAKPPCRLSMRLRIQQAGVQMRVADFGDRLTHKTTRILGPLADPNPIQTFHMHFSHVINIHTRPSAFRLKTSFRLTSVSIPVTYLSLELNRRTHTNTALQNSESRHKPPQLYQSYAPLWVQTEENLSSDHFLFLYCRLRMYRGHDAYMKRL